MKKVAAINVNTTLYETIITVRADNPSKVMAAKLLPSTKKCLYGRSCRAMALRTCTKKGYKQCFPEWESLPMSVIMCQRRRQEVQRWPVALLLQYDERHTLQSSGPSGRSGRQEDRGLDAGQYGKRPKT